MTPVRLTASNAEIASELHLTVPGVKSQIRTLFARFGVEELPQNQKRSRLAALAIEAGAVSHADLKARPDTSLVRDGPSIPAVLLEDLVSGTKLCA